MSVVCFSVVIRLFSFPSSTSAAFNDSFDNRHQQYDAVPLDEHVVVKR